MFFLHLQYPFENHFQQLRNSSRHRDACAQLVGPEIPPMLAKQAGKPTLILLVFPRLFLEVVRNNALLSKDLTSSRNEKNLEMLFQEPGEWKVSVGCSSTHKLSLTGVRRSPRLPQSLLFSWLSSRCPEDNGHFGSRNVEGAPRKPGHRWDVLTAVSNGVPLRAHVTFAGRHHRFITPFHSLDKVALKPIECPVI